MILNYDRDDKNAREIRIEHNGEMLEFDISKLSKKNSEMSLIVGVINNYFQSLPMVTQDAIWSAYSDAYDVIRNSVDLSRIDVKMRAVVTELYKHISYESVEAYIHNHADLAIPADLKVAYGEGAPNTPLTYLLHEYKKLLNLVVFLKPMLPIWGEYDAVANDESGTQFKVFRAMKLLRDTEVVRCEPYQRLNDYMGAFVGDNPEAPIEAVLGGLGSVNIRDWLLGLVLMRRLTFCELVSKSSRVEPTNVVSNIYNYVRYRIDGLPKAFGGMVRDKKPMDRGDKGNGEDNTSFPELYKMKSPISEGSIMVMEQYLMDPLTVARHIEPKLPSGLLNGCIRYLNKLKKTHYHRDQITLVQYCLSKVISPRGIPHLNRDALTNAMAITQALLWYREFYDLAILMTSTSVEAERGYFSVAMKLKLETDVVEKLLQKYPHSQPQRNPKKDTLLNRQKQNPVIQSIESVVTSLDDAYWTPAAPDELLKHSQFVDSGDHHLLPSDIKNQLAKLILTFC